MMDNLHTQAAQKPWGYWAKLQGREPLIIPLFKMLLRTWWLIGLLIIGLVVAPPAVPYLSGNSISRDIIVALLYISGLGAFCFLNGTILTEWFGKGVYYNLEDHVLEIFFPTNYGFGGPRTEKFKEEDRQLEQMPVAFPWNIFFAFPKIDEIRGDNDQKLWWVSHNTYAWLETLVPPKKKDEKREEKKKGEKTTEKGETFELRMLKLLIQLNGTEDMIKAQLYIESISEGEEKEKDRAAAEERLRKLLVEKMLPENPFK